ncbi:MAG: glutathione peroxidase [Burkholderiaceae bacterium]
MSSINSFSALSITGEPINLSLYQGDVILIVNVASKCGFTPQYQGLESLYREFKEQGLAVLGFPCDQFGHQEPGNSSEIRAFCSNTYEVTFPLFEKIEVNGPGTHPVYSWLKSQKTGFLGTKRIKWNFTKFLLGRDGQVIERYGSATPPHDLRDAIEHALKDTND